MCSPLVGGAAERGFRVLEFRTRLTLFFSQLQGSAISLSPRLFLGSGYVVHPHGMMLFRSGRAGT